MYLGHVISKDGIKPDPKKLDAVRCFPRSKTPKKIKQFLDRILSQIYTKLLEINETNELIKE